MNKKTMKKLYLLLLICPLFAVGQSRKINLEEAIKLSQEKSVDYEIAVNKFRSSYWRYRNHKASFLPQVRMSATIPNYTEQVDQIPLGDGTNTPVYRKTTTTDVRLYISQNVGFTGGTLSLSSSLNKNQVIVTDQNTNINYDFTPYSINYYQNSLFYNPFKWNIKIEPLYDEASKRDFIENMEEISLSSCNKYFTLLKIQIQSKIVETNFANADTLYKISKGRFSNGKIAENDLLRMELRYLNAKNDVTNNAISLKKASQNLALFLGLNTENLELEIPEKLELFDVSLSKALSEAKKNRQFVINFRIQRLEAEQDVARVKGTNRLTFSINANFGQSANSQTGIVNAFDNYNLRQGISLKINAPIFDWGVSKSARKKAEAQLDLTNNQIEQDQQGFEQEIELHVMNWSTQRDLLAISKKAQEIAIKSYEITQKRYILGKVPITDLNISLEEKDKAIVTYLNSLGSFWQDYYTLRRLTLYDFIENKKITAEDLIFD